MTRLEQAQEQRAALLLEYQNSIYACLDAGIEQAELAEWLEQTVQTNG